MSRSPVLVRDARQHDTTALCRLWGELLATSDGGPAGALMARGVQRAEDDPASRIIVAEVEGEVVGCAYLRTAPVSPVHDEHVVHLSHVQVDPGPQHDGVERALVEGSVRWAEHRGVETLVTSAAAQDRDANRFLARLGLAQVAVLRTASVAALRARLPQDPSAGARAAQRQARSVGQVVAARRSQRRARTRHLLT